MDKRILKTLRSDLMINREYMESDDIKNGSSSNFNTTDEMELNPGEYFVKEKTKTTVGRFIYNK